MSEKRAKLLKRKELLFEKINDSIIFDKSDIHFIKNHEKIFSDKELSEIEFHIKYPCYKKYKGKIYHNKKISLEERVKQLERQVEVLTSTSGRYRDAHFD